MQQNYKKKGKLNKLKASLLLLMMVCFAGAAMAQGANEIRMKTGTETITDELTYNFYDTGGPYIMDPEQDPDNNYNWVTWYQHNESYLLHFTNPVGGDKGIKIVFNYILLNNDHLKIYEGDLETPENLIVDLTNNDYSTNYPAGFTVVSHGNMTIRFESDYHWRDAGWDALVELWDYAPQPPVAVMEACDNYVTLLKGSKGTSDTKMYYTTDGNDPAFGDPLGPTTYEYTAPFEITEACTVKTITVENGTTYSEIGTYTFNRLITPPGAPTITHVPNTNIVYIIAPEVPADQNDTYYVRYTIDGTNPIGGTDKVKGDTIELHSPCTVRAVTRGTTCPDIFSTEVSETISTIYVPTPEITVTGVYDEDENPDGLGNGQITCSLAGATIYYTLDGTTPTVSSPNSGTSPISLSDVPAGTTIKAMAHLDGEGYENSNIATFVYIPTNEQGEQTSGVFGSVVLLDDREPHSWSYYSDGDQPVHSLKPADVKITYLGYGSNTMTSTNTGDSDLPNSAFDTDVASTAVAVGPNEAGNQFVYLKTLEAANEDGSGDYPYTLIPNPFSKRPAGESVTVTPTTRTVYISGRSRGGANNNDYRIEVTYRDANNNEQTWSDNSNNNVDTTISVKTGSSITLRAFGRSGNQNNRVYSTITARYDDADGQQIATATATANNYTTGATAIGDITEQTITVPGWRGFYAWRVKRLSNGLSIKDGEATLGVGSIIPAETEIKFVATANSTDNEVEFEALWAQAYVVTSNTATGLHAGVSYERNFVVGAAPNAALNVPVTYSRYNPDGTGGANTVNIGTFTCAADTKFEYMNLNNGTLTANNHDLIMGRGLTGTAARIRGTGGAANNGLNYMLRVESGTYTVFSFVNDQGSGNVSGRYLVKSILGSDYDRATNDNSKLSVSPNNQLFYSQNVTFGSNSNRDAKTLDLVVKSGSYQSSYWPANNNGNGDYQHSMYLGQNSAGNTYPGCRYAVIEGGELASILGGRGVGGTSTTYCAADFVTFDLRIKGGLLHGSIGGGASDNPSIGSRRIVITGGEVQSWVAAGANGTGSTSGNSATNGDSYVYIGGNAVIGGDDARTVNGTQGGQVFGAGRGIVDNGVPRASSVNTSNVVIADNAEISNPSTTGVVGGNVYGGGYNGYVVNTSNVYILGGTVQRNVFGGSYGNGTAIPTSKVHFNGGAVNGSVYGGSNYSGTVASANVTMTGGTTTNVYGAGLGNVTNAGQATTNVAGATVVAVSGGTINNNVYGGGALGTVTNNTSVTVSGGTMKNIFGAGQGRAAATGVTAVTANIGGTTTVTVSGGTIAESVYGGGENGNVKQPNNPAKGDPESPRDINPVSTVEIEGGTIAHNVFGGGNMGFTNGGTVVNMIGGTVEGSVFGGAFGTNGKVYVAGQRTVNMRGGTVNKHVYGGSRNADDALTFNPGNFDDSEAIETASVVNMSGGYVHYQVFASGYFGNVFGSTYAFIGTNAILNAPYHVAGDEPYNEEYYNHHYALRIGGSVWAGGDFGNYDGSKFGDPTISGRSHVYIDGTGYDTESNNTTNTNYMYIGGSIYGSGTSCDAGMQGRNIILRNYGQIINASQPTAAMPYSSATRALYSIQRADKLTIDNAHVVLLGEGKINSLVTTEKYTIHEFQLVRLTNGSSIFLNFPADQIMKFGSYTCEDVYDNEGEATYTKVEYNGLGSNAGPTDNKIRVSNGAYINIYHDQLKYIVNGQTQTGGYGELEGFAHMMSDDANSTCAYARPKQSTDQGNIIPTTYNNPNDGGFISYDQSLNTYDLGGGTVTGGNSIQMPYENHTTGLTKNGEQYFRIWRAGGDLSYREGVFVAQGNGTNGYNTIDVIVGLPAFENCASGSGYYRLKSLDGNTLINQGTDVMLVNAACYGDPDEAEWMYINGTNAQATFVTGQQASQCSNLHWLEENPNVNFGLVAIPSGGLEGNDNMLICEASDPKIATMQWTNLDNTVMPQVTFRLTYNTNLTNNVVWDPMIITFEQVDCSGQVSATVDVALTVTTLTTINQAFKTQAYAIVRGTGSATDSYTAKVVLPQYVMHVNTIGEISQWTCTDVDWHPESGYSGSFVAASGQENSYLNPTPQDGCNNKFGMTLVAGLNFDNTTGWESWETVPKDMYNFNDPDYIFGSTTARDPIGFDFTLLYDGRQRTEGNYKVGELEFTMHFTNYESGSLDPYSENLTIIIEVFFKGQGNNYYIDGVNGNNLYSGKYPNAAKKTLSGIFNRTDYVAGDNIFVVDAVTAEGGNKLTWNGKAYNEVTLYRYPGGHQCVPNDDPHAESHWEDYDIEANACYQGPLVKVDKTMDMTGIVLNGFYEESKKPAGTAIGDIKGGTDEAPIYYYQQYVPSTAPLVEIHDGGTLSVYGASRMEFNYNSTTDGGGVYVENGGVLNLYNGSAVDTNYVASGFNGGGIYVNSTSLVQLSDEVYVTGNCKGIPSAKEGESVENNVYLSAYDSHVNVGTAETDDPYTKLLPESRVGITKINDWGDYYYAPVAYSDGGQAYLSNTITENAPSTGAIMWDDQTKYEILALNNTHLNPSTNYVYFVGTWVTEVTENPQHPTEPNNFDLEQIDTPYELAWLISYVNGLNGADAHPGAVATLTGDIDMSANIWVPITNYTGIFNGNGHVVTGLRSPLNNENMGMFGLTTGATIRDLVAQASFAGGTMMNVGTLIGTMNGGTLSNVEASGTLTGTNNTVNIGGLVGQTIKEGEVSSPVIHSAFAVNTMTGGTNTVVGGLVGTNGGDLYNSFANTTMSGATKIGGLVGVNDGHVENCYAVVGSQTFPAFANTNNGVITVCYADKANGYVTTSGEGTGVELSDHGTYGAVETDIKALGYMYGDNLIEKGTNTYVGSNSVTDEGGLTTYIDNHIPVWNGLLSALNQWVRAKGGSYASWNRPLTQGINGDLPILAFPKDNCVGNLNTQAADGKMLHYSAYNPEDLDNYNGLDNLLGNVYKDQAANIYLYKSASNVVNGTGSNKLFIHEDAALVQNSSETINATVGVTFDNSKKTAADFFGTATGYDWHLLSSPLTAAPMGTTYSNDQVPYGLELEGNITKLEGNYFPDGLLDQEDVTWDLYTYYEPQYHWINFKRSSNSHWHYDNPNNQITYTNETTFTQGKGYMMAISQDSYLNSTGTLTNGPVTIGLTAGAPDDDPVPGFFTYDKGSNLVGNPYHAYLDLSKVSKPVAEGGTGFTTFYIYDAEGGIYVPFKVGMSSNPVAASQYIHPHQGFFVVTDRDEDFTITYDMATATKDDGFYYRGDERVNYPLVNLFAENARGNRDLTIIEFNRPEIGGARKIDNLRNANFKLAAHLEGESYGVLFAPEGTERVPVRFTTGENGTFTLTWSTFNGDFSSLLLVDNMTGTITDMLRADHYTFDASVEDYASRFYITYCVTGVDEHNEGDGSFAYYDGSEWIVEGQGTLDVVDVLGRTLYSERLVGERSRVSLNGVSAGVYLLRVSDGKNTMVQKIVVR